MTMLKITLFFASLVVVALTDPPAKVIIRAMDKDISNHIAWDDWPSWSAMMEKFFTKDMIYDTNYFDGTNNILGNGTGLRSWFLREHLPINKAFDNQTFNQMIFAAEDTTATTTTYAVAPWTKGPFVGVGPPHKIVRYRIFDFYIIKEGKIWYNWMILDTVHLLYQAGFDVLPNNKNPLKQGWVRPPNAMDGIPMPISYTVSPGESATAKAVAMDVLNHDLVSGESASPLWNADMVWYGSHGFGFAENKEQYNAHFIAPLRQALSDRRIELDLIVCEGKICGAHGYLVGKFMGTFLGEQPSNATARLRFGLHWHIDVTRARIIEGYGIFDLPGFFIQAGINLFERAHHDANVVITVV